MSRLSTNNCGLPLSSEYSTADSSPMPQRRRTCTTTRVNGSLVGMSAGVRAVIWQAFGFGLALPTTCSRRCTRPALARSLLASGRKPGLSVSNCRTRASCCWICGRCAASMRSSSSFWRKSSI